VCSETTFESITCPICGSTETNEQSQVITGIERATIEQAKLVSSACSFFNVATRAQQDFSMRTVSNVMDCFEQLQYPCAPSNGLKRSLGVAMLHIARCEAHRLQTNNLSKKGLSIVDLPLGPLGYIKFKQNVTLQTILRIIHGKMKLNVIQNSCIICYESFVPRQTVQSLCSCFAHVCQQCARHGIVSYTNPYKNSLLRCFSCRQQHVIRLRDGERATQFTNITLDRIIASMDQSGGKIKKVAIKNLTDATIVCVLSVVVNWFHEHGIDISKVVSEMETARELKDLGDKKEAMIRDILRLDQERLRRQRELSKLDNAAQQRIGTTNVKQEFGGDGTNSGECEIKGERGGALVPYTSASTSTSTTLSSSSSSSAVVETLPLGPLAYVELRRDLFLELFLPFLSEDRDADCYDFDLDIDRVTVSDPAAASSSSLSSSSSSCVALYAEPEYCVLQHVDADYDADADADADAPWYDEESHRTRSTPATVPGGGDLDPAAAQEVAAGLRAYQTALRSATYQGRPDALKPVFLKKLLRRVSTMCPHCSVDPYCPVYLEQHLRICPARLFGPQLGSAAQELLQHRQLQQESNARINQCDDNNDVAGHHENYFEDEAAPPSDEEDSDEFNMTGCRAHHVGSGSECDSDGDGDSNDSDSDGSLEEVELEEEDEEEAERRLTAALFAELDSLDAAGYQESASDQAGHIRKSSSSSKSSTEGIWTTSSDGQETVVKSVESADYALAQSLASYSSSTEDDNDDDEDYGDNADDAEWTAEEEEQSGHKRKRRITTRKSFSLQPPRKRLVQLNRKTSGQIGLHRSSKQRTDLENDCDFNENEDKNDDDNNSDGGDENENENDMSSGRIRRKTLPSYMMLPEEDQELPAIERSSLSSASSLLSSSSSLNASARKASLAKTGSESGGGTSVALSSNALVRRRQQQMEAARQLAQSVIQAKVIILFAGVLL
jgi:hypothetical protein